MITHRFVRLSRGRGRVAVLYLLLLALLFGGALRSASAQAPVISETLTFDNDVGPGNPDVTGLEIGPWFIASQKFHTVSLSDAGVLGFANNGTPFIASVGGGLDFPITLERADGSPFSLVAFDAAEGFLDDILAEQEGFISAAKIEIEAALSTGFTLTLEFDLDGLRDGAGFVDDFETFAMPGDLASVTSVTFTGLNAARRDAGFALDNVVVGVAVPEPAAAMLLVAGVATLIVPMLSAARRRQRIKEEGSRIERENRCRV
jgi:hypothetical protein